MCVSYCNEPRLRDAIIEFDNNQPSTTIHELSIKHNLPSSVLGRCVNKYKSKRLLYGASIGNNPKHARGNKPKHAKVKIYHDHDNKGLPSTETMRKVNDRKSRDAKQKKWRRIQTHLQNQVSKHKN